MRTLFDTNILLDLGLARKPFAKDAFACLKSARETGEPPRIAPHALATFFYIMAQARDPAVARAATVDLIETSIVVSFGQEQAERSLKLDFGDFEDAMIAAAAEASEMDWILTRNGDDFRNSPVPALSPGDFLERMRRS